MTPAPAITPALPPMTLTLSAAELTALTGGTLSGALAVSLRGAAIDSRAVAPGNVFVCLPGAVVDGHDFAAAALTSGAALLIVTRPLACAGPQLLVADATMALNALAGEFRRRHPAAMWIGVTGSNGKTTTKELLAAALAGDGAVVHATRGNLNNHLGIPLTVLATPREAQRVVIEMGANHQGEIAGYAAVVQPTIGVITGLGPAHLEGFGGLAGVASGKSELFTALPANAPALLSLHGLAEHARTHGTSVETLLAIVRARAAGRILHELGSASGAVHDDHITLRTVAGEVELALLGAHNLANAALAWQAAVAAGVDPAAALRGLATVRPVAGRLAVCALGVHRLIDDTYNANPGSMVAGLDVLAASAGLHLAVLGGMGELGAFTAAGHRDVGAAAAQRGVPLITVGPRALAIAEGYHAAGGRGDEHHDDFTDAVAAIQRRLANGPTTLLIKASRSAGLDRLVALLSG